jgi:hypothetical protein
MPIPQFKVRKVNGITEIKLADDPTVRTDFVRIWKQYAPLLSERGPAPSFEELKQTPQVTAFVEAQFNAGKTFTFQLQVKGANDNVIEKEVVLLDDVKKVCAISKWTPIEGITFTLTS